MCGFAGFFGQSNMKPAKVLDDMASALSHRGPNDKGVWFSETRNVGFAHSRLSIIDLSINGHQPMESASGRYVIAYNGEIYNHLSIRSKIDKINKKKWRGYSDTETLLMAFETWGIYKSLKKCKGMFAFAVMDLKNNILTLARDRLGEKPLYYGWQNGVFLFGSELKSLKLHPAFNNRIDRNALALFLRYKYIPCPYSIYKNIKKLEPSALIEIEINRNEKRDTLDTIPQYYWSLKEKINVGITTPFEGKPIEAIDKLEVLLKNSIKRQMISDVPLGAFLSGGIDSSTIVALMQQQSIKPIKTYTIGFQEEGFNEAIYAKKISKFLGTDHTELYVSHKNTLNVIPDLPIIYDEPFADESQIPTFLVSKLASQNVTVSLSGDAGDELFSGYNRYFWSERIWPNLSRRSYLFRKCFSHSIKFLNPRVQQLLYNSISTFLPKRFQFSQPVDKIRKFAHSLLSNSKEEFYHSLVSTWDQPNEIVIGGYEPKTYGQHFKTLDNIPDFAHVMMYLDTISYLPDDILVKLDRAAMNVSLETRVPFLDHHIIEFAWQLPLSFKIRDGNGKWILKQLLKKYIPLELIERPKMGFGIPLNSWLRGPLKDWGETLLDETRLSNEGYFNPKLIRKKWDENLSGKQNWPNHIWNILIFQQWLENQ
tara:strand:- start:9695 stop:11650 length:1956 start_codon:yes stop_codon:yes gene_type:complete